MPDVTLSDVCSEHRRRYPDRLAVIDGAKRYTWPQFDDRVNRAARVLTLIATQEAKHAGTQGPRARVVGRDVDPS